MAMNGIPTARSTFCVRGGTRGSSSSFKVVASRKLLTVCLIGGLSPAEIAAVALIVIVASYEGMNTSLHLQGGAFNVKLNQP
jgi:hypothetical protein